MPEYGAPVTAVGKVSAEKATELTDAEIAVSVDTGDLPRPEVNRLNDGRALVEASEWKYSMDYEGEFDDKPEFRACLENSLDTGDLSDPKVGVVNLIGRQKVVA